MIEEHHISNLDPGAFFSLHDYDSSSTWTSGEILRTYGLDDPSSRDVPESKRQEVVRGVLDRFDQNGDGVISRDEWVVGWGRGGRLPDFGVCLFDDVNLGKEMRLNFTDVDLDLGSLDQGIMVMTSTSMKFTILKSFTMRVRFPSLLIFLPPQNPTHSLKRISKTKRETVQIPKRKTSRIQKTLRISRNTTRKRTLLSDRKHLTDSRSSNKISRKNFGGINISYIMC